jgi:hypothetical protein
MDKPNTPDLTAEKLHKGVPFAKGNDPRRNLEGRPVGSVSIVEGIKKKLQEIEPVNKKTYLELFLNSYFKNAIKDGDTGLIRDMINRVDGMPAQKIEAAGNVTIQLMSGGYGIPESIDTTTTPNNDTEGSA